VSKQETGSHKTLQQWYGAGAERVTLALVFTDIVGSTALCHSMGDESWIRVLISHFDQARRIKQGYDCHEIKIIGDSFMIVFRTVADALRFAMDFHRNTGHDQVKIRVGIHFGAVRIIGDDIYGGNVNYASRVVGGIKDAEVSLSDAAKRDVSASLLGAEVAERLFNKRRAGFKGYDTPQVLWGVDAREWWEHQAARALPTAEELEEELGRSNIRHEVVQASHEEIDYIAELEIEHYKEDAVPARVLRRWYNANPTGFSVIKNQHGQNVGHIDLLPVRPEPLREFLEGKLSEREIGGDELYTPSERHLVRDLYVESIITRPSKKQGEQSRREQGGGETPTVCVLKNITSIVGRVCDASSVETLYAIAATGEGAGFMRKFGFSLIQHGGQRTDHHDLYAAKFEDFVTQVKNHCQ
jgi:class 3 adenylate cyclase